MDVMGKPAVDIVDQEAARATLENIEVRGPDEDGFIWLVFHGRGDGDQAMINLSAGGDGVVEVGKNFEAQRRQALGLGG